MKKKARELPREQRQRNGPDYDPVQRTIVLPVGRCVLFTSRVVTVYPAPLGNVSLEVVSEFSPPIHDPEFRACAVLFGYDNTDRDVMLYGLEHDLTHHLVACLLGAAYSRVVWADAHGCRQQFDLEDESRPWPWRCSDEEHLTNHLLLYAWHGQEDTEHGILHSLWEDNLPVIGEWVRWWLRPHRYDAPIGLFPLPMCTPWPDKWPRT